MKRVVREDSEVYDICQQGWDDRAGTRVGKRMDFLKNYSAQDDSICTVRIISTVHDTCNSLPAAVEFTFPQFKFLLHSVYNSIKVFHHRPSFG